MITADIAYALGNLFGYAIAAILVIAGVVALIRKSQRRRLPEQQFNQRLLPDDTRYPPHDLSYPQPSPYGSPDMPPQSINPPERNGTPALLGFIFSLISILGLVSYYSIFLLSLSIAGVILSSIGLRSRKRHSLAVAGLVISIIVLIIGGIYVVGLLVFLLSKH